VNEEAMAHWGVQGGVEVDGDEKINEPENGS